MVRLQAQRLPLRVYTMADGLPSTVVMRIVSDSRGFIWVCTRDGLSRFDGAQFVNYTTLDGLPHTNVNDLLEAHDGSYWVATNGGGVARFNPAVSTATETKLRFTVYSIGTNPSSNYVNRLLEDKQGRIWAATDHHVFRLDVPRGETGFRQVELPVTQPANSGDYSTNGLLAERNGAVWVGYTHANLFRIWPDGRVEDFTQWRGLSLTGVTRLLLDRAGTLWTLSPLKLVRLTFEAATQQPLAVQVFATGQGELKGFFESIHELADGRIWVNTVEEGYEFDGVAFKSLNFTNRIGQTGRVFFGTEDKLGNHWLKAEGQGVVKVLRQGFTSWRQADAPGLLSSGPFFQTPAGELFVNGHFHEQWTVSRLEGETFHTIRMEMPKRVSAFWRGTGVYCDRQGEWWAAGTDGLYRFGKLKQLAEIARAHPRIVYRQNNGLPHTPISVIFEDQQNDLWLASTDQEGDNLIRWERATETFHIVPVPPEIPLPQRPQTFAQDSAGNFWIGFDRAGLARYRDGRWQVFTPQQGWPAGTARDFHWDRAGRLWLSTAESGAYRIDQPLAEQPQVSRHYTMADGLSSNAVLGIEEDQWGRLYFGTTKGVNRLDPARDTIRHFTTTDGLTNEYVFSTYRDTRGHLWFGTSNGVSRLIPEADPPPAPPPIYLNGLRIAGLPHGVSELGESAIGELQLTDAQRNVELSFFGFSFGFGERLRFQYKLEGADRDWSQPDTRRSVNYANLAPGSYRFLVRAINVDGLVSEPPASVRFTIPAPFYLRWWFVTFAALGISALLYAFYRYRLTQMLAVERVRMRIATDLHDDIGSNLTRIAMLSEVAQRQLQHVEPEVSERLTRVADISRESVDSLSDIVWAINPDKGKLGDLTQRMRRIADDLCAARGIDCLFQSHASNEMLVLETDLRRELLLIFKECLNNAARHSGCRTVEIELRCEQGWLRLQVRDDGSGLTTEPNNNGHGLASMRQRAERMGGQLELVAPNGHGTTVTVQVPLKRPYV